MGSKMKIRGLNAELLADEYAAPVRDGLVAWCNLTDNVTKAPKNLAPSGVNLVTVGAPTVGSGGGSMVLTGNSNYYQTNINDPMEATIFMVAKTDAALSSLATRPIFYAADNGVPLLENTETTTGGLICRIFDSSGNKFSSQASRGTSVSDDVTGLINQTFADYTAWALTMHEIPEASGVNTMTNVTTSSASSSSGTAPRFPTQRKILIGSGHATPSNNGTCEISQWIMYDRLLSTDEKNAIIADIRAYQLRRFSRTV